MRELVSQKTHEIVGYVIAGILILFLLTGCSDSRGQRSVLRGQVVDQNCRPVKDVRLFIIEQEQQTLTAPFHTDYSGKSSNFVATTWYAEKNRCVKTNRDGFFQVKGSNYNRYFLQTVQKEGYGLESDQWIYLEAQTDLNSEVPLVIMIHKVEN